MHERALARAPDGGVEHFARNVYFDHALACQAIKVLPGEYHVASHELAIVTVLGSCVSACLRDTRLKIGGMNHFMLPDASSGVASESARYGAYAMELLLNHLLKMGARRENLEAKVFGGGRVLAALIGAQVGERNAEFVQSYLQTEKIPVVAADLLDIHPRKICFFPQTGRVLVKRLHEARDAALLERERAYAASLKKPLSGAIELF
ncbi:chemoreceptor glutamine deamidase CheD [Uliginosibacterium sediminicola]|uniref:Probable chemoreceptor glutamine deamidase CheD n=1 Tax=Uliginosibacterium sediminicola TaxID=2024550 RepID=A0ABU9Z3U1_9RHOO